MSNTIWQKIDEIFPLVAELPAGEREARVREICAGQETLAREILALLAADEKAGAFCEVPAVFPESISNALALTRTDVPTDSLAGAQIGTYRILSRIGTGGMGAVYLARRDDGAFEKKVAVKLVRRGIDTDFNLRRFRLERQALAALEHPNIARLIDAGATADGLPYFVMEFVAGKTLFHYCDSRELDLAARLALFRQICAAVGHAHEKQIVHRDLKPGNILVTDDGTVKLLDFGIAKILDEDLLGEPVAQTETLLRQMTPEYASPEQIRGEEITPATDVYSLGVILYELVTGERPYKFPSRAPHEIARVICEEKIRLPRYKFPIPNVEALNFIILKTLEKNSFERFSAVPELDQAVARFLQGLPVMTEDTRLRSFESSPGNSGSGAVSLAVAPFQILRGSAAAATGADDDFLGIGLADALTTKLSGVRQLALRPTSSVLRAAANGADARAIGSRLGADYVLEGHILRAGTQIRVTVQLLKTEDFSILWAQQFDEADADIFHLQDSISARVTASLIPRLTTAELEILRHHGTENAAAYEAYLRGRVFFHNYTFGGISAAESCFAQAIALDPNFALAHCGLADFYNLQTIFGKTSNKEGFERAKKAALKAIELDPNLAEAHAALAFTTWAYDWDFERAEEFFRKAIHLNPNYARAHEWFAFLLSLTERHDEALKEIRRAEQLDPGSAGLASMFSLIYYNARRYEESLTKARRALELDPDYYIALQSLGWICPRLGRFDEAIEGCRRAVLISDQQALNKFSLALALIDAGQTGEARALCAEIETRRKNENVPAYYLALIYAALGEDDRAFEWFDKALNERGYYILRMRVEPRLDRLRRDPRFAARLEQISPRKMALTTHQVASPVTGKVFSFGSFKARITAFAVILAALIFPVFYAATGVDFNLPKTPDAPRQNAENEPPPAKDEVAAGFYAAGKHQMATRSEEGIQKAIDLFTEAVKRDPDFALAYSALADAYILCAIGQPDPTDYYRKAEENALKALALDPDLAQARISLGMAKFRTTNDFAAAERHFLRAIEINPSLASAHHWYAEILNEVGRSDDALREMEIAAGLDENSAVIQFSLCHLYIFAGRHDDALIYCDKAIKADKSFIAAYYWKSFVEQSRGEFDASLETYRTGRIYSGEGEHEPVWILKQAQSHAAQKRRAEALDLLNRYLRSADFRKAPGQFPQEVALVYNLLGETDRTFEWLARAEVNNRNTLRYLIGDPRFANLRNDARFSALVEKFENRIQTPK